MTNDMIDEEKTTAPAEDESKTTISGAEISLDDEEEETSAPEEEIRIETRDPEMKVAERLQAIELELQRLEIELDRDQNDLDANGLNETVEYVDALNERIATNKKSFNALVKESRALQRERVESRQGTSFFEDVPLWEYIYTILMAIAGLPWIITMLAYFFYSAVGSSSTSTVLEAIILFSVPFIWILPSVVLFFTLKKGTGRKFFRWISIVFAVELVISLVIMIKALA